jgi:hypothetical protein
MVDRRLTKLNSSTGYCFGETVSLKNWNTETCSDEFVRVWSQWSSAASHESDTPSNQITDFTENDSIYKRSVEPTSVPLELIIIEELEDFLTSLAPTLNFLLNPLEDSVQNKLEKEE